MHESRSLVGPLAHCFRGSRDGFDNIRVASAAAQVGRQDLAQFPLVELAWLLEYPGRQHQETWRAKPALQAMMLPERLLQWMQDVAVRKALDRADFAAVCLHPEHQAGAHRCTIDDHRAGAADTVLAAEMGASQPALIAQRVRQAASRFYADFEADLVCREGDVHRFAGFGHRAASSPFRIWARIRSGVAGNS